MTFSVLFYVFCFFSILYSLGDAASADSQKKKILFILTNVGNYPGTNRSTGWYLPELARPYKTLFESGFELDSVSPLGGLAPLDAGSAERYKDEETSIWFLADPQATALWQNTKKASEINAADYDAVFIPGGRGPIYDLSKDKDTAAIIAEVYENGGVVAALCHGPVALLPVKLSNGEPLVKGLEITGYSNAEEEAVGAAAFLPILLETELIKLGANFTQAAVNQVHTVVDERLVSGQNPPSTDLMTQQFIELLQ